MLKIVANPNKEHANKIRERLKNNDNYCPCALQKTPDTKCMCKNFREQVSNGVEGYCHCGLWKAEKE